jgi:hypothetical protein
MTTCDEPILGSLYDLRNYQGGGSGIDHYVQVPCGLTTTHRCRVCDLPICRWHLVSQHDHTDAAQRKIRAARH